MFFKRDATGPGRERRAAAIAVAPFDLARLDAEQARIASAFLEDVISELARFPNFEVLAARTSLSLTPEQLAPQRLAEEFGVTHLLDSSLRPAPGALKVKANLVETATGKHLWPHGYDVSLQSLTAVEDELAAAVANQRLATAARTVCSSPRRLPTNDVVVQHACADRALAEASDRARLAVARAQARSAGRVLAER